MIHLIKSIKDKIRHIIKYGVITYPINNSKDLPIAQVTAQGIAANSQLISPYGLSANVPHGTKVVQFELLGITENKAFIAFCQKKRIKILEEGEVAINNPQCPDTYIRFKNDGTIEIICQNKDITVKANNVKIDANKVDLGSGGNEIARKGDTVHVNLSTGDGYITSGGTNTSI